MCIGPREDEPQDPPNGEGNGSAAVDAYEAEERRAIQDEARGEFDGVPASFPPSDAKPPTEQAAPRTKARSTTSTARQRKPRRR